MNFLKKLLFICIISIAFVACESDDNSGSIPATSASFETGILVSNEGPFNMGNGSISFIDTETGTVANNIFTTTNPGEELGNIVQSIGFTTNDAYIIANNSNKITVVDRFTFESKAVIETGLVNPRYFVAANEDTAYITNWGDPFSNDDDYVAVLDLVTNEVIQMIPVAFGPERMVLRGNKLYVANKGGFDFNTAVTVIDIDNNTIINTITVGDVPGSMQIVGNDLWVLCEGKPSFTGDETAGSLYKVNMTTDTVDTSYTFDTTEHPNDIVRNGINVYYILNGAVHQLNTQNVILPGTSIVQGSFYEIAANDGKLYTTDALDFNSDGTLTIYDIASGMEEGSYTVGIIPGGIYFNE